MSPRAERHNILNRDRQPEPRDLVLFAWKYPWYSLSARGGARVSNGSFTKREVSRTARQTGGFRAALMARLIVVAQLL